MATGLSAVAHLTDALSRATTLEAVYDAALDALQEALAVARASVLLFDEHEVMSFVAWRGLSDDYRRAVNGHTPWTPRSENARPICVADVTTDASLAGYEPVFASEGIRALGFFPLVYRGGVIGKFMLYYAEPHACDDNEIELAQTIAGQIAFGVARVRVEAALALERDRLNTLVANIPGVVWESVRPPEGDHTVTFVSEQIESLLGYSPAAWYANPYFTTDILLEDVLVSAAQPQIHHHRVRRSDGRIVWSEVRLAQKLENGLEVTRGVSLDITQQKLTERRNAFLSEVSAILSSSLDYEVTLGHVAQLVVPDLADWCTIDVIDENEVRRVTGLHHDPAKREAMEQMRSYDAQMQRSGLIRHVIDTREPRLIREYDYAAAEALYTDRPEVVATLRELGTESFMVVPLIAGGRCLGAITLVSSEPQRRFDDDDLDLACELGRRAGYAVDNARLYRQAQEANRAKDEFLVTLSHELRTPMTATLGWAALLRRTDFAAEHFQLAVETIERSTRAQAKLIDDILDVSRIVTGKLQLNVGPVDMRAIVEAAIDAMRPSLAAKQLELDLSLTTAPVIAVADGARLQQVLWNLLSNSVKFTPSGGTVAVRLDAPESGEVQIIVRDTGNGIPRKFLPYIFERFRQADSGSSRAHGGLGLGLAIVKSIVELHGGSVIAESEGEGCGATFTLTLPVTARAASPAPVEVAGSPLELDGVSVLLVEDETDTRLMLSAALQSFGARVTAVDSVAAAVASLETLKPNVVVSDIAMPGEDGMSLMLRIRSEERGSQHLPAIAVTAYASPADRDRILAGGFDYHLPKPVDPMTVVKTVHEALSS
ncbi:MAG: GAF domain-containing protein [Acidobacteria bacterium]|nr:GAF domain-containing protein [Acidobacteriota bacterium]MBV9474544.1 GAF domain-containing protein [Acidobacteriota bacterium]